MARRPLFIPRPTSSPRVEELELEFEWFPGFALVQAQRSIRSLHRSAARAGVEPILEISSKSEDPFGVAMSAFNLSLGTPEGETMSVECAFQGSKVFAAGGPFVDLHRSTSREARRDPRLRNSGALAGFRWLGFDYPLEPKTAFYDWLYAGALAQHPELLEHATRHAGFTDIAFNPKKSINCQARAVAALVALVRAGSLSQTLGSYESWVAAIGSSGGGCEPPTERQERLF